MKKSRSQVRRSTCSISHVLHKIDTLESKTKRVLYALGYRSSEISKTFRQMITVCNSVSIVFLQFDLLHEALYVLQKAVQTDTCMFFEGEFEDRTWQSRPLIYCNLGYLLLRVKDYTGSLKFLYDAESLLIEIKQMSNVGQEANLGDMALSHAAITFLVLCSIQRYEQAEKYLESATEQLNLIIRGDRQSRINRSGCSNLYCLFTLAIEIIQLVNGGDLAAALSRCKSTLKQIKEEKSASTALLEKFVKSGSYDEGINILLSDEYRSIMFITTFFPFIAPRTPVINFSELSRAQEKARANPLTKREMATIISATARHEGQDNYALIMKDALANAKKTI
ncbi:unnamed protein product [Blepharisma stoltei]|uniref:Uncharacterized protein n=1 Tax=Blepharisma stoltei TaxID=1481888 RepID=A0AAU9ILP4_9CILI|nr:unnamed protein product [Blepharisma stoltei]